MLPISRASLLQVLVGSTWQNFIGLSYEQTRDTLQSVLDRTDLTYTVRERSSSSTDSIILGGGDTTVFEFEGHEFIIECVSATYDPVQRGIMALAVRNETKSKYEHATTVLRISPVTEQTESDIMTVLNALMKSVQKDPWDISHPRFKLSPVLQYKTRLLWEYWESDTRVPSANH